MRTYGYDRDADTANLLAVSLGGFGHDGMYHSRKPKRAVEALKQIEKDLGVKIVLRWGKGQFNEETPSQNRSSKSPRITIFDLSTNRTNGYSDYKEMYGSNLTGNRRGRIGYIPLRKLQAYMRVANSATIPAVLKYQLEIAGRNYVLADIGIFSAWVRFPLVNFEDEEIPDWVIMDLLKAIVEKSFLGKEEIEKQRREQSKLALGQVFEAMKAITTRAELTAKQKVADNEIRIQDSARMLARAQEGLLTAKLELRLAREVHLDRQELLEGEMKLVRESESFDSFEFEPVAAAGAGPYLNVYTNPVYLYTPNRRKRVYLGKFKIRVNLGSFEFSYVNLDNKRGNGDVGQWAHPHTGHAGHMCMGNYTSSPGAMFQHGMIYDALEQAIHLLEAYNPRDAGSTPYLWFNKGGKQDAGDAPEVEYLHENGKYYRKGKEPKPKKVVEGATMKGDIESPSTGLTTETRAGLESLL